MITPELLEQADTQQLQNTFRDSCTDTNREVLLCKQQPKNSPESVSNFVEKWHEM